MLQRRDFDWLSPPGTEDRTAKLVIIHRTKAVIVYNIYLY